MAEMLAVVYKCDWRDLDGFPSCETRETIDAPNAEQARGDIQARGWRFVTPRRTPANMHEKQGPPALIFCQAHATQFTQNGGITDGTTTR